MKQLLKQPIHKSISSFLRSPCELDRGQMYVFGHMNILSELQPFKLIGTVGPNNENRDIYLGAADAVLQNFEMACCFGKGKGRGSNVPC